MNLFLAGFETNEAVICNAFGKLVFDGAFVCIFILCASS